MSERKYFDSYNSTFLAQANANWDTTVKDPATLNTLFAPTTGNDISNREARNVYVHTIRIKGYLRISGDLSTVNLPKCPTVRIILVIDKQTNGTQMTGNNLMASSTGDSILAFVNTANFGRFEILKDKMIQLDFPISAVSATNTSFPNTQRYFKIKHTFKTPLRINFNSNDGGTVADIVDNSFHIVAAKTEAPGVAMVYNCRVGFTG